MGAARAELLLREKAHTRAGDAHAAARRRLPMVELDGTVAVTGADGPVPFLDLFEGRDGLVVYPPGAIRPVTRAAATRYGQGRTARSRSS